MSEKSKGDSELPSLASLWGSAPDHPGPGMIPPGHQWATHTISLDGKTTSEGVCLRCGAVEGTQKGRQPCPGKC